MMQKTSRVRTCAQKHLEGNEPAEQEQSRITRRDPPHDNETRQPVPEHEHALEKPPRDPHRFGAFPHEKLDVYRVALQMARLAKELAKEIPRGHRHVADHLQR